MKNDGEEIVALKIQMGRVEKDISEIKTDIKTIMLAIPSADALKVEIQNLKEEIEDLRKSGNLWKFLSPTFAAILGSILTFLLIQYITNLK